MTRDMLSQIAPSCFDDMHLEHLECSHQPHIQGRGAGHLEHLECSQ